MGKKSKEKKRAKRALVKRKYADIDNSRSSRVDKRVEEANRLQPIDGVEYLDDIEIAKKMRMARGPILTKDKKKK